VGDTPSFKLLWHTVRVAAENEHCYLLCLQLRKLLIAEVDVFFKLFYNSVIKKVMDFLTIIYSPRIIFIF